MATTIPTMDDPCARVAKLREMRDRLLIGEGVEEAEFDAGNGTRRRVRYGRADTARLDREIDLAQAACDKSEGRRGRRFVIGGRP